MKIIETSNFYVGIVLMVILSCSGKDDPKPVDCSTSTLSLSFTSGNPTSCTLQDGTITANPSGGVTPYQFAIDAQPYSVNSVFNNLQAGTYILKVKDQNGCVKIKNVTINPTGSTLAATILTTKSGCKSSSGSITINASGGTGPLTYQINNGAVTTITNYTNLGSGTYAIKVTDAAACSVKQNVYVPSGTQYSIDVKPILEANCGVSACHVSGGAGPFLISDFSAVQIRALEIKATTQNGTMPKNRTKLPQAQLDAISCWVDDGALNN